MTEANQIIHDAAREIYKAAKKNKCITLDGLKRELEDGLIEGWISIPAVSDCNFSQWSAAMELVIIAMEALQEFEVKAA